MSEELSEPCASIAFMTNLVYDRGVALEYDLLHDRLEDAERRLADLEDMIPQVYGLTDLTTPEERADLVRGLGKVRSYIQEGDTLMGQGAADEFNASFRTIMWNIIIRCRERVGMVGPGTSTPPVSEHSPSPQTYDDWARLAAEINAKYPDDPAMRAAANFSLRQIAEEKEEPVEAREEREQAALDARTWLASKARELGII